jgi:hypothetical protein
MDNKAEFHKCMYLISDIIHTQVNQAEKIAEKVQSVTC